MIVGMRPSLPLLLLLLPALACHPAPTASEMPLQRAFGKPLPLCALTDTRLDESSGVAPSVNQAGVWYTHNDSGDTSRFFRFKESGEVTGVFSLKGASAVDWEDMASASVDGTGWLYFGDIGDNLLVRKDIRVYRVAEPAGEGRSLEGFDSYVLKYPDGSHNAEALMVRQDTGDVYVVTKSTGTTCGVYKLASPKASGTYTLAKVGDIKVGGAIEGSRLVTAGDISPDGRHVAVRTYLAAYEFEAGSDFDAWVKGAPRSIKTAFEVQGEGIAYARDGRSLVTTSEGTPCPVSRIAIGQ